MRNGENGQLVLELYVVLGDVLRVVSWSSICEEKSDTLGSLVGNVCS